MIGSLFGGLLSWSIVPMAPSELATLDPCAAFNPAGIDQYEQVGVEELLTIADIGQSSPDGATRAFGLSPDETRIAFVEKRANPEANAYCLRLMVAPLDGRGPPSEFDRGGEFIHDDLSLRDFAVVLAGWERANPPRWSPDGTRLAYLKRIDGTTQVWLADGKAPASQATQMPDNVDAFAWSADGAALVVATRPDIRAKAAAIEREAARGFLFDERFSPQFVDRPIPTGAVESVYYTVPLDGSPVHPASAEEIGKIAPAQPDWLPEGVRIFAEGGDGARAWLEPKHPDQILSPTQIILDHGKGNRAICRDAGCEGVREIWWSERSNAFLALQKTGWANSQMALLRWEIGEPTPYQILLTDDVLIGCLVSGDELICAREGSTQPRRLVAIDARTGIERVIFDPNPDLANARFGKVRRLRFRNEFGAESFADLVLPPDHQPGEKHPLVVVQYTSNGFLRGGTGDEVPIFPLAARGFAVLSFARPAFAPEAMAAPTVVELSRANRADWLDRRRVQSSLETAVKLAIETGAVDAERMGISGFSDGSATVQWALIHSDLFKVASMGSCCEDLYAFPLAAGPGFTQFVREFGYRHFEHGAEQFWRPVSLVLNVDRINVPILIQTADSEYEGGLDVAETFSNRNKAFELFVFNNETHVKWQPAHRRAMYERSLEWFDFWLMHRVNCDPLREAQYVRWKAMVGAPPAGALRCSTASSPQP